MAFTIADIPLEKVNSLLPFFQKHVKQGGFIPQAPTLRQIYLPQVFENHLIQLKLLFENKPVAITMDKTTDNCTEIHSSYNFNKIQHSFVYSTLIFFRLGYLYEEIFS